MSNKRTLISAAVVVAIAVVAALYKRSHKKLSPEDEIRVVITRMVDAANDRDVQGVVDHIGAGFSGSSERGGTFDRKQLKDMLLMYIMRGKPSVDLVSADVTVLGPAEAQARIALTVSSLGRGKFDIQVEAGFAKEDGWKVVTSQHTRSGGGGMGFE